MNHEEFIRLEKEWWESRYSVMGNKSAEYAKDTDKLYNFKRAAALQAKANTPAAAAWNMNTKHLISIVDMIETMAQGKKFPIEVWREKIGDATNYLDLLWAIINEQMKQAE